jgi:signal transduction histidine kinase
MTGPGPAITINRMPVTPATPRLKRVTPGMWVALAWCAVTVYTFVSFVPLPAGGFPTFVDGGSSAGWHNATSRQEPTHLPVLFVAGVLAIAAAVLLSRRPLPAFALLLAASLTAASTHTATLQSAMDLPVENFLAADVALGFIAAHRSGRTSKAAGAMALATIGGWMAAKAFLAFPFKASMDVMVALTVAVAWLIGNSIHQTREHAQTLSARAAEQATISERLRISRELHDAVAHSIGIIALQSGAARRCMTTQPQEAHDAMAAVERASRETLSGLRRMLGALRQSDAAPLEPAPGLADVDGLAASTTAAGVHVEVLWRGEHRPLPREIDRSAFRIIQESVTNVVRHSGTKFCLVSVEHRGDELVVEIVDRGRGCAGTTGHGFGLTGMRERVGLLDGEFFAGPRPDGGFRVTARLPVPRTGAAVSIGGR